MTTQGSALTRYRRAIQTRSLLFAEIACREMGFVPVVDALDLVLLYSELEPTKFERAASRWLQRLVADVDLSLDEIQLAAALLATLPSHPEGADVLRRLART